jgi:hypothetical protein
MASEARLLEGLLRADFRAFLHKTFLTLSPGQTYVSTWHVEAIAYQLERVRRGEVRRLIINMPPRSLKSIAASVAFPAFLLGHEPSRRIICVSYSGDLAKSIPMTSAPWSKRPGIGPPFPPRGSAHTRTQRARSNSPRAASGWRHLSGAH